MRKNFGLAPVALAALLLCFLSTVASRALAQENTSGDSITPLIYTVENTGASYPKPVLR